MAMRGIGVQRHIAQNAHFGHLAFDLAGGLAHQVFRVQGFAAVGRSERRVRVGEERDHRNFQLRSFSGSGHRMIHAEALHARHGGHGVASIVAILDEDRPDEIMGRQAVFGHQIAGPGRFPVAPHAVRRKARRRCLGGWNPGRPFLRRAKRNGIVGLCGHHMYLIALLH